MGFARWVYGISGLYGTLLLVPGFFLASRVNAPLLSHPEFYYGFYGCALAWQFAFFLIASNPARWRALMPITFLEKASYFGAGLWLYQTKQLAAGGPFYGSLADGIWLVLFVIAWLRTPKVA